MPAETKLYNFRLSIALMERVKATAAKHGLSMTDVVLTKLRTFADEGVQSNIVPEGSVERIAALEAEIERLGKVVVSQQMIVSKIPPDEVLLDMTKKVAQLTSLLEGKRVVIGQLEAKIAKLENGIAQGLGRSSGSLKAVDPKVHHPSGPVLADPVPRDIAGETNGHNPRQAAKGKR